MYRRATASILAVGFALAGCGGSSSNTLTHAQLVAKANALCAQRNASIQALPKSLGHITNAKSLAAYLDRQIPILQPLIAKLNTLKPPAADKKLWDQAMSDNNRGEQLVIKTRAAAHASNDAEVQRLTAQLQPLNQRITSFETHFGLADCLKQPVPSS